MKFQLMCVGHLAIKKKEDLTYFENIGFVFKDNGKYGYISGNEGHFFKGDKSKLFIEIDNLEQLEELEIKSGYELIISFRDKTITIYNDYIE